MPCARIACCQSIMKAAGTALRQGFVACRPACAGGYRMPDLAEQAAGSCD